MDENSEGEKEISDNEGSTCEDNLDKDEIATLYQTIKFLQC